MSHHRLTVGQSLSLLRWEQGANFLCVPLCNNAERPLTGTDAGISKGCLSPFLPFPPPTALSNHSFISSHPLHPSPPVPLACCCWSLICWFQFYAVSQLSLIAIQLFSNSFHLPLLTSDSESELVA